MVFKESHTLWQINTVPVVMRWLTGKGDNMNHYLEDVYQKWYFNVGTELKLLSTSIDFILSSETNLIISVDRCIRSGKTFWHLDYRTAAGIRVFRVPQTIQPFNKSDILRMLTEGV